MEIEFGNDDAASMLDAMRKEDEAGKFTSKYWSPKKEGVTKIRFLPKLKNFGEDIFYQKHKVHYVNGRSYLCLEQTLTDKDGNVHEVESCPFCQKSRQLYQAADNNKQSSEWKMAGELRSKDRFVSRIIVRGNKNEKDEDIEWKPEFYEFGKGIREIIMAAIESGEFGQPIDLKNGRDFSINKKGQKQQTKYDGSMFSGTSTPIFSDTAKLKQLLAELPKMDYKQLVEFETPESLKKILKEYLNGEDEEPGEVPNDDIEDSIYSAPKAAKEEPVEEEDDIDSLLNSI